MKTKQKVSKAEFINLALDEMELIERIATIYLQQHDRSTRVEAKNLIKECRNELKNGTTNKIKLRRIIRLAYRLLLK